MGIISSPIKQALILAAGRGSRMGGYTEDSPKCAVMLNGHPLLYWQVLSLRAAKIEKIAVVSGYQADYFRDLPFKIDQIVHNDEWSQSNMVWSMLKAGDYLREPTIISYSDIIYDPQVVVNLSRSCGVLSITCDMDWLSLWSRRFDNPLEDAETFKTDGHGKLIEIGHIPQSLDEIEAQYMGLLKVTREIIMKIKTLIPVEDLKNMHMTGLIDQLIKNNIVIDTVKTNGGWCEVDSAKDLEIAKDMVRNKELLS